MDKKEGQGRPADVWQSGPALERYVGRWSRLVGREFLRWLDVRPGSRWVDIGCGTGALTETILQTAEPSHVTGVDRSEGFIAFVREQVRDERAQFKVGDAQQLPLETATCEAAVSGLVLNFVPRPTEAMAEMVRVVRPGGTVAGYVWDYAGKMQFLRHFWDAAVALDPEAAPLDEGPRFPLCQPEPLKQLFQNGGLEHVEVRGIEIPTVFKDFDDYWVPFLGGQGPAPGYAMSLSDDRRNALRERIRASLPFAPDSSIPLVARAWAARGVR